MTLTLQGEIPVRVEKSEVKILAQGLIDNQNVFVDENKTAQEYDFFAKNENTNILVTNQDFKNITDSQQSDYIVLDAREDIEYENGYFPGSLHIRFADLKAGRWIELPKDKFVYVICWSGIRGKEVAEFLRTKKIIFLIWRMGLTAGLNLVENGLEKSNSGKNIQIQNIKSFLVRMMLKRK